ncbi:hypothetical protein M3Y98_01055700 [Aphelenchoides besseyi]|nr:hypothetical protein M3Y98_01055700 [Aphelenchoides besseyi]
MIINSNSGKIIKAEGDLSNHQDKISAAVQRIIQVGSGEAILNTGEKFNSIIVNYAKHYYVITRAEQQIHLNLLFKMQTRSRASTGRKQKLVSLSYDVPERKAIQMVESIVGRGVNFAESTPTTKRCRNARARKNRRVIRMKPKQTKRPYRNSSGYESYNSCLGKFLDIDSQETIVEEDKENAAPESEETESSEVTPDASQELEQNTQQSSQSSVASSVVGAYNKASKHPTGRSTSEEPGTPVSRPWKDQVKSARKNHPYAKRMSLPRLHGPIRHSLRSAAALEESPKLSRENKLIKEKMEEIRNFDSRELKRQLKELGKNMVTPLVNGRVTYDLLNPKSINRKYIDDAAEMNLEEGIEPGESELLKRPGIQYLMNDESSDEQ